MNAITRLIRREPAALTGAISAVIGVLLVFGVITWTDQQLGVVMVATGALMVLVRNLVTPVESA